jgi:[NiFe] hydrogenase assembly HybE family chaperone
MTLCLPMPDAARIALCAARAQALQQQMRRIARERMRDLPLLNPALQVQAIGWQPLRVPANGGPERTQGAADGAAGHGWMAVGVLLTPWSMNLVQLPLDGTAAALLPAPGAKAVLDCGGLQAEFIGAAEPLPWTGIDIDIGDSDGDSDDFGAADGRDAMPDARGDTGRRAADAGTHGAQCSLFSPVLQFTDQGQACAVAHEVLRLMRQAPQDAGMVGTPDGRPAVPAEAVRRTPTEAGRPTAPPSPMPRSQPAPPLPLHGSQVSGAAIPATAHSRRGFLFGRGTTDARPSRHRSDGRSE